MATVIEKNFKKYKLLNRHSYVTHMPQYPCNDSPSQKIQVLIFLKSKNSNKMAPISMIK